MYAPWAKRPFANKVITNTIKKVFKFFMIFKFRLISVLIKMNKCININIITLS